MEENVSDKKTSVSMSSHSQCGEQEERRLACLSQMLEVFTWVQQH